MAVVREMRMPNGALVRFHDDDYINVSREEIKRRHAYACELAYQIMLDNARRQAAENSKKEQ